MRACMHAFMQTLNNCLTNFKLATNDYSKKLLKNKLKNGTTTLKKVKTLNRSGAAIPSELELSLGAHSTGDGPVSNVGPRAAR